MTNLYVCRWTNRNEHKQFTSFLQHDWHSYEGIEAHICYHGRNDLDQSAVLAGSFGRLHGIHDFRNKTNGTQQGAFSLACHELALASGCPYYGIVDDDANFTNPVHTISKVEQALSIMPNSGATGPFDNYRMFSKYKDRNPSVEYQSMVWSPWTTTGVQFYRANAMRETYQYWKPILEQVQSNVDYPVWLTLWYFGFSNTEFHDITFKHACSNGDQGFRDQDWYMKRIHDGLMNQEIIRQHFEEYPKNDNHKELLRRVDVIERNRIQRTIKDGENIPGHRDWDIPLLNHFDNRWNYFNKFIKDRPEVTILK